MKIIKKMNGMNIYGLTAVTAMPAGSGWLVVLSQNNLCENVVKPAGDAALHSFSLQRGAIQNHTVRCGFGVCFCVCCCGYAGMYIFLSSPYYSTDASMRKWCSTRAHCPFRHVVLLFSLFLIHFESGAFNGREKYTHMHVHQSPQVRFGGGGAPIRILCRGTRLDKT